MSRNRDWDDDNNHPTNGFKGDTTFLRSNYKLMEVGGVFRTVKAQFSPEKIHAEAEKAGWVGEITDESPWLKVKVMGKVRR